MGFKVHQGLDPTQHSPPSKMRVCNLFFFFKKKKTTNPNGLTVRKNVTYCLELSVFLGKGQPSEKRDSGNGLGGGTRFYLN